jgi:hypothetical protein
MTIFTNGDWSGEFRQAEDSDKAPWIEIDLDKPHKIGKLLFMKTVRILNLLNFSINLKIIGIHFTQG